MIFTIPTIRLGRYVPGSQGGDYLSCELVPDDQSNGYTLVSVDTDGEIAMSNISAATGTALLDKLVAEGYARSDPYIPSTRKKVLLGEGLDKDAATLQKLRGQGGTGLVEKLQGAPPKASKWDGGFQDEVNLGKKSNPIGSIGGLGASLPSALTAQDDLDEDQLEAAAAPANAPEQRSSLPSDAELDTLIDNIEQDMSAAPKARAKPSKSPEPDPQAVLVDPSGLNDILDNIDASIGSDFEDISDTPAVSLPPSDFLARLKAAAQNNAQNADSSISLPAPDAQKVAPQSMVNKQPKAARRRPAR